VTAVATSKSKRISAEGRMDSKQSGQSEKMMSPGKWGEWRQEEARGGWKTYLLKLKDAEAPEPLNLTL
jgi:hypothetical protein